MIRHPKHLTIQDFTYPLPAERIAERPLATRDASRLLTYEKGDITTTTYQFIADELPAHSLLIFNNTKVVEARLLFQKPSGGLIEIFCLEPHQRYGDITTAMQQQKEVVWHCLVGGASKWKAGQVLEKKIVLNEKNIVLSATFIEKQKDSFIIALSWTPPELSFAELLHYAGAIPLPPYIKRKPEAADAERYQTVYADTDGSVAAPTAGLHFTNDIFEQLEKKHIEKGFVTLHVGAGTFKPVKSNIMQDHEMHAEWIDVSNQTIDRLLAHQRGNIVAVGTTSLRTIESLYWIGAKMLQSGEANVKPELLQWEAYELAEKNIPVSAALKALLQWMKSHNRTRLISKTQLLIAPGYEFKLVNGLVTNFHQPQSTLLLLVAALIGEDWKKVYDFALANHFRFLSYGDGSLLWKNKL